MWTVIKFEKKQINFLRQDLTKNLVQTIKYIYLKLRSKNTSKIS